MSSCSYDTSSAVSPALAFLIPPDAASCATLAVLGLMNSAWAI
jgi:hypothetical protein